MYAVKDPLIDLDIGSIDLTELLPDPFRVIEHVHQQGLGATQRSQDVNPFRQIRYADTVFAIALLNTPGDDGLLNLPPPLLRVERQRHISIRIGYAGVIPDRAFAEAGIAAKIETKRAGPEIRFGNRQDIQRKHTPGELIMVLPGTPYRVRVPLFQRSCRARVRSLMDGSVGVDAGCPVPDQHPFVIPPVNKALFGLVPVVLPE